MLTGMGNCEEDEADESRRDGILGAPEVDAFRVADDFDSVSGGDACFTESGHVCADCNLGPRNGLGVACPRQSDVADMEEEETRRVAMEQGGSIVGYLGDMSEELSCISHGNAAQREQGQAEREEGERIEEKGKKKDGAGDSGVAQGSIEVEEEDEEDDVDFNPYLQRSPSREPSSAVSSEAEEEGEEVDDREGQEIAGPEVEGAEDLGGFELEDDDDFLELGSEVDEEEFLDYEDYDIEEEDQEEEEEEVVKVEGEQVSSSQQEWREAIEVELGEQVNESLIQRQGLERSLQAVWCSDSREGFDGREKERLSASIFDYNTKYSSSQERVDEEMMMGRALESLPELRSPRSERQQELDASQQRAEEEVTMANAISKRTRAHYSLTDMSLDQLETFLQESDEEDYFQNVDDEEEYRKFLAAVQEKVDTEEDEQKQEKAIEEESESEDEDADFEIEIEEALESDFEEGLNGEGRKRKRGRRPETREKRRQRAKLQNKVRLLGLAKAPLRQLLPYAGCMPVNASVAERSKIMADRASKPWSSNAKRRPAVNGFTAHQIGQLYCLMHEHVQLLVQVFAMCILEPARQQVAIDTHRMLMELVEKRESMLSWKKSAFPDFCFRPPYTHPSVTENEMPNFQGESLAKLHTGNSPVAKNIVIPFPNLVGSDQQYVTDVLPSFPPNLSFPQSPPLGAASPFIVQPISPYQTSNPFNYTGQSPFHPLASSLSPQALPSLSSSSDTTSRMFLDNEITTNDSHVQETVTCGHNCAVASDSLQLTLTSLSSERRTCEMDCPHGITPCALSIQSSSLQTKSTDSSYSLVASNALALPSSSTGSRPSPTEWVPATSCPVRSLVDVAPLALSREFLTAIAEVVQDYRQQHVESGAFHAECEKEPLFAVRVQSPKKATAQIQQLHMLQAGLLMTPIPQVKKTMAAALVESTKKQSVALVPKDVAAAMQRFLPLFNKGLFPHKAPPASTANRLLFTDAEDELLAMGLMTYNTDWTAIQQRFLPSKSMHQIFVRQKNRSSARAPENSIKAVRRMKSSPLTTDEKACIQEALKAFKYDWAKVWQFCVPHRDPATLPRQWRIALGTQKSYKSSETNKVKRRMYEAGRRQAMAAQKEGLVDVEEESPDMTGNAAERGEESDDEDGEEVEEAYIRDAFLADWNPQSTSSSFSTGVHPVLEPNAPLGTISTNPKTKFLKVDSTMQTVPSSLSPGPSTPVQVETPYIPSPYTSCRRPLKKQTVKLAPGLPSLQLPPTVRVLSQSNSEDLQSLTLSSSKANGGPPPRLNGPPWCRPVGQEAIGMGKGPAAWSIPCKQKALVTTLSHMTSSRKLIQVQEDVPGNLEQAQQLSRFDRETRDVYVDKQADVANQAANLKHQQSPQDLPGGILIHPMLLKSASHSPAGHSTASPNLPHLREQAAASLQQESPQFHPNFAREPSQVLSPTGSAVTRSDKSAATVKFHPLLQSQSPTVRSNGDTGAMGPVFQPNHWSGAQVSLQPARSSPSIVTNTSPEVQIVRQSLFEKDCLDQGKRQESVDTESRTIQSIFSYPKVTKWIFRRGKKQEVVKQSSSDHAQKATNHSRHQIRDALLLAPDNCSQDPA